MTITIQPIDASAGAPAYTAQQERQALAPLLGGGSVRALGANSGFRVGTPTATVTVTSTTWTVAPCSAIIDPAYTTVQGAYRWSTDVAVTGSVTAADATNPRKDILYIQVNDASVGDGSGARNANILYLAGTPAATPSAPALPARSFLVATIDVPKVGAGSPTATFNSTYFVAAGGVQPVASQALRDAMTPYPGFTVWRTDINVLQMYTGTVWRTASFEDRPMGHMGRTGGFQSLSGINTTVMDTAPILRGGVTFDNANDALIIPVAGYYRVTAQAYFSGAASGTNIAVIYKNAAQMGIQARAVPAGGDTAMHLGGTIQCAVGDAIKLAQQSGGQSAWGSTGYDGSWLEIDFVGV
jgi:hypothetical protein